MWILGAHTFTYCLSGTSLLVNITETLWQGTLYRSKRDLFPDVQIVLMVVTIPILSVLYVNTAGCPALQCLDIKGNIACMHDVACLFNQLLNKCLLVW